VSFIAIEHRVEGGRLGRSSSARRHIYKRLKDYADKFRNSLLDIKPVHPAIGAIYARPLTEVARDVLNRDIRAGIGDEKRAELVRSSHEEDRLRVPGDQGQLQEPRFISSLGIRADK
jgi:hypothetical protein